MINNIEKIIHINDLITEFTTKHPDEEDICRLLQWITAQTNYNFNYISDVVTVIYTDGDPSNKEEFADERFFSFIRNESNEYYNTHTGNSISEESHKSFRDNDIRNGDDLSDEGDEFNTREYDAFDHALDLWEAIQNKD